MFNKVFFIAKKENKIKEINPRHIKYLPLRNFIRKAKLLKSNKKKW